jgi:hypothetical protein
MSLLAGRTRSSTKRERMFAVGLSLVFLVPCLLGAKSRVDALSCGFTRLG